MALVLVRPLTLGGSRRFLGWFGPYVSLGQGGFNGVISFADTSTLNFVGMLIAGTGNNILQSAPKSSPNTYTVRTTPISTNNTNPICVVNDDLLFIGLNDGAAASRMYRFVPSTDTFTNHPFPSNSDAIGSIVLHPTDSNLLIVSNLAGAGGTGGVWTFNMSTNVYTQIGGSALGGSWNLAAGLVRFTVGIINGTWSILAFVGLATNGANVWQSSDLSVGGIPSWTQIAGAGVNGSWATGTKRGGYTLRFGGITYACTLGGSGGDAEVWERNENTGQWTQIGGDGINSGWAAGTHTTTRNMVGLGNILAVPVGGTVSGDAEGWQFNISTRLWTQVAGDGIGSTWPNRIGIFGCALTRENHLIWFGGNNTSSTAFIYDSNAVATPGTGGSSVVGPVIIHA
jgi:hypothetical protein